MLSARISAAKRRKLSSQPSAPEPLRPPSDPALVEPGTSARPGSGDVSDNDDIPSSQGSYMLNRMFGGASRAPSFLPSSAWWSRPMYDSIASKWDSSQMCSRRFRLAEACAGMGSAAWAAKCFNLPFDFTSASDMKPASRTFFANNHTDVKHFFPTMQDQAHGGFCLQHGHICDPALEDMDDLLVAGPPCQPFSHYCDGSAPRSCWDHDGVSALMGNENSLLDLLKARTPRSFLLENVLAFARPDRKTGTVPLVAFADAVKQILNKGRTGPHYTAMHVFEMGPNPWLAASRPRSSAPPPISQLLPPTPGTLEDLASVIWGFELSLRFLRVPTQVLEFEQFGFCTCAFNGGRDSGRKGREVRRKEGGGVG